MMFLFEITLLDYVENVAASEFFLVIENPEVIFNHLDALFVGRFFFLLWNSVESVTHDSNKKVHESNLSYKCRKDKE